MCMCMMFRAAPSAMCGWGCGAGVRRCSFQYKTTLLGRVSLNTWLLKNLQYVLSTFELFLVFLSHANADIQTMEQNGRFIYTTSLPQLALQHLEFTNLPIRAHAAVAMQYMPRRLSNTDHQIWKNIVWSQGLGTKIGNIVVMLLYRKYYWCVYQVYNKFNHVTSSPQLAPQHLEFTNLVISI